MASKTLITERLVWLVAAIVGAVVLAPPPSSAHDTPRTAIRELVRLQGYLQSDGSDADPDADAVEINVNGKALTFHVSDRQVFIAVGASGLPERSEPKEIVVRGQRELLARIAQARPDQRMTLLGERRPGAAELFVAAVDLCPDS